MGILLPIILKPLLTNMMQSLNAESPKDDKVDKDAEAPAWAHSIMDRLDKLENAEGAG